MYRPGVVFLSGNSDAEKMLSNVLGCRFRCEPVILIEFKLCDMIYFRSECFELIPAKTYRIQFIGYIAFCYLYIIEYPPASQHYCFHLINDTTR